MGEVCAMCGRYVGGECAMWAMCGQCVGDVCRT